MDLFATGAVHSTADWGLILEFRTPTIRQCGGSSLATGPLRLSRTSPNALTVDELSSLFRPRVGLILGPGAVHGAGVFRNLAEALADQFVVPFRDRFDHVGDEILLAGTPDESLRDGIYQFMSARAPLPTYQNLANVGWTAVLSSCFDPAFDDQFRLASERRLMSHTVNVVTDLFKASPPRTVPVFKLLGSTTRRESVISTDSYSLKRGTWPSAVRAFVDLVRDSPVLCLGMSECPWVLSDLLGVMAAQPTSTMSSLVVLTDDPLARDQTFWRLLRERTTLITIDAELRVVLGLASARQDLAEQQSLPLVSPSDSLGHVLRSYSELVVVVADRLKSPLHADQVNQLHELLFSPAQPKWDAFAHHMDFRRTITRDAVDDVELSVKSVTAGSVACVLSGGAASGKTTVLKKLAFELASRSYDVLWLLPWFYQDTQTVLVQLFKAVAAARSERSRIVVFMDDPVAFGTLTAQDVVMAAESCGIEIVLIVGARTSEWKIRDNRVFVGSLQILSHWPLPDELDSAEWEALPKYLVKLGVFADQATADQEVQLARSRRTSDILTMLYWMVPETRKHISHSVQDEYFRLGDSAGLTRVVIGDLVKDSTLLQRAYELIAVAEHYRTPVPLEVLVAALDVRYDEWLDASSGEGLAWGLFYADVSGDGETVSYRTRNSIVTDVIIRTINGGDLAHTGELRGLGQLLAACRGTQPLYREFCVRVLVPADNLSKFEYLEGLDLYDAALNALPYPDKTLVHHKGLWIKNFGHDPLAAKEVLLAALETPVFPYTSHAEANEHIFTSLAANELTGMKMKLVNFDDAKLQVLHYLDRARSNRFFNPNAIHVEARLMHGLIKASTDTPDRYALINRTLSLLDRTMLLLRARTSRNTTDLQVADNIKMLEAARAEILQSAGDFESFAADADDVFEATGRQDGFVLVARALYQKAVDSEKGTDFNSAFAYCQDRMARIKGKNSVPRAALLEVAIDIYYHWRIVRRAVTSTNFQTDWLLVREYCDIILRSSATPDPFHEYLFGLTMAHLGDWPQASALFANLRRSTLPRSILWSPRDFLLSENGTPRRVQGEVKYAAEKGYLYVEDLHFDFILNRTETWPKEGETAHAFIRFAFAGPSATGSSTLGA